MELASSNALRTLSKDFTLARDQLQLRERFQVSSVMDAIKKDSIGSMRLAHLDTCHLILDTALLHAQREPAMLDTWDALENINQEHTQELDAQRDLTPKVSCAGRDVQRELTEE